MQLKFIKKRHRTSLKENTLDQLLRILVEGPPLSEWTADGALELWLREKASLLNWNFGVKLCVLDFVNCVNCVSWSTN